MNYIGKTKNIPKIRAALSKGWVIANHILVSFHVAFISSVLSVPGFIHTRGEVLKFIFTSRETIISALFWYLSFHIGVAIHEMGHYIAAVRLSALNPALLPEARKRITQPFFKKFVWYLWIFVRIPYGKLKGIKKNGLEYHPDAPYNLAVSAAGPATSQRMAIISLPIAIMLLAIGIVFDFRWSVYIGRLFLGIGLVGFLDYIFADPGKYSEYRERESAARKESKRVTATAKESIKNWTDMAMEVKDRMVNNRMQRIVLKGRREVAIPWQFRNCGMGGRHTEKEFPESNISLQESMFIPLSVKDYQKAQEMTVNLQTRLKEIIENSEGCTVKGIGTEGGIAAYIKKEPGDILPVQRLWRMQKQAILDCGYIPGKDVAMALDPAASELEIAYRKTTGVKDEIGIYEAWRDESHPVLARDELLNIYIKAVEENNLPIISIEDGFAEDDDEGWKIIMKKLGDRIHIIGDDNITTKDSSIEEKANRGLINTALIKLNQIGTVTEGVLAILTAIGKNLQTVVSHRSKSPIEDFEAHVALASNSLGLKAGGGSNAERLCKYETVVRVEKELRRKLAIGEDVKVEPQKEALVKTLMANLSITEIVAREVSTNTGIPTVGVEVKVGIAGSKQCSKLFSFGGATPLGTSAGTDEAIHLIDSIIPPNCPTVKRYPDLFLLHKNNKTYRFRKEVDDEAITKKGDTELTELWKRAKRYKGKGCLNAVDNVKNIITKLFLGKKINEIGKVVEIDRSLLELEKKLALERGILSLKATKEEQIEVMQRKANLGMNAILSVSLAMARLMGNMKGQLLWEVIREQMTTTMSKTIVANGGMDLIVSLKDDILDHRKKILRHEKLNKYRGNKDKVKLTPSEDSTIKAEVNKIIENINRVKDETDLWKTIKKELTFGELCVGLQKVDKNKSENIKLYELLREQLPVYGK